MVAQTSEPVDGHRVGTARQTMAYTAAALAGVLLLVPVGQAEETLQARNSADLSQLSIEELADIEITSVSKRAESLSDAAAAVYVITGEDIRRSGATSLPEALRLAPNLEVARVNANNYSITARGFNANNDNKMLVLIDGRTVYTQLHSGVFWDVQDVLLEDVERIEVISGPGGTLWGSNAVNGVINIITKRAQDTQGGLVSLGAGNDVRAVSARYGSALGEDGAFRLYAKGDDQSVTKTPGDISRQDAWRKLQTGFRTDWAHGADSLTLQGDAYHGVIDQPQQAGGNVSGGNLLGRWGHALAQGGSVQVQAYYDRTERHIPGSFGETVDTYDLDAQHSFKLGERHELVWGGGYRLTRDTVDSLSPLFTFEPAQRTLHLANLFVQDTVSLNERLKLTVGEKLEHNDYTGLESQPSVRLAWKWDERSLLWGAVSRAVRTPSRLDRDFFVTVPNLRLLGGPDFQSERLTAYELGYRTQPNPRLSYSLSTFYNHYDELRSVEAGPLPGTLVVGNKIAGYNYGLEAWGNYQVRNNWRLSAGFNVLRQRFHFTDGSLDLGGNANTASGNDPARQLQLRSSLDLPHGLEFDTTLRAVSSLPGPAVPGYVTMDARLGWHVNQHVELSLSGFNLLGRGHVEASSSPASSEIGRSVFVNLLWKN